MFVFLEVYVQKISYYDISEWLNNNIKNQFYISQRDSIKTLIIFTKNDDVNLLFPFNIIKNLNS